MVGKLHCKFSTKLMILLTGAGGKTDRALVKALSKIIGLMGPTP
jgi:hypothetical protein